MKTAISLPDDTYDRATRRAGELGLSRSEFFARAALRYLDELDARSLTARIDEALDTVAAAGAGDAEGDSGSGDAIAAGRAVLGALDDEW
ncbi:ribbon-helix-helix protein, CopG family [Tomitella gaofuii]|uniref:ribbon-helix-helix protein, CopG family n=1 Tax=Tomitella gaofuii TaxID=2760083 RepID=UPI0015F976F2|nr:ribbon-helix-helix protein, CopG family [Tomitella gaofuii]